MNSDHKIMAVIAICLAITISAIAWAIAWYNTETMRALMAGNYVQQQVQGSQQLMWVKPTAAAVDAPAEQKH